MPSTKPRSFGSALREIRREEGKTLEDLALVMEVSIPYASDIEREKRSPPPRAMIVTILSAWNRMEMLDDLACLAIEHRGELQIAAKNAEQRNVLVALARVMDTDLDQATYTELMDVLNKLGKSHVS